MSGTNELWYGVGLDNSQFNNAAHQVLRTFKGMGDQAQRESARIDKSFKSVGLAIGTYFGGTQLLGFVKDVAKVRGEFQQLDIAFQTMLKNKAKADKLMEDVVNMAANTPYELSEVGKGAKQLLAFQVPANEIVGTMRKIGDLAAGVNAPLTDMVSIYGKVKAKGKLQAEEMNLFLERGIPLVSELAKNYNTTEGAIYKMAEQGRIGFSDLQNVISNLTEEGGMFFNLMEKQSKSFTGQISNLSDAISQMMNEIGSSNEGLIYDSISGAKYLVEHYKEIWDIIKVLAVSYGTYRAALISVAAAQKASLTIQNIQAWFQLAKGIRSAKDAQIAFNLATKANPMILLASAIAGVITALVVFNNKTDKASKASAILASNIEGEKKELDDLFGTLRKAKEGTEDRKKAIEDINGKYGTYLDNLLTEKSRAEDVASAYDKISESIVKAELSRAKQNYLKEPQEDLTEANQEFYKKLNSFTKELNSDEQKGRFQSYINQYVEAVKKGEASFDMDRIYEAFSAAQTDIKYNTVDEYLKAWRNGNESFFQGSSKILASVGSWDTGALEYAGKDLERFSMNLHQAQKDYTAFTKGYLKKSDDDKNSEKKPENINALIAETKKQISEAEETIKKLRSGKIHASDKGYTKDIEAKLKDLSTAQKKLQILTGEKKKAVDVKKQTSSLEKLSKERIKLEKQIAIEAEQARVDAMKDGIEKTLAQNELNHTKRLTQIEEQKSDLLEKMQEIEKTAWLANGGKGTFKSSITELPTELNAEFIAQTKASILELENSNAKALEKLLNSSEMKNKTVGAILKSIAKSQKEKLANIGQYETYQLKELAKKEQSLDAETYKKRKVLIKKEAQEAQNAVRTEALEALKDIPEKMLDDLFKDFDLSFANLDHATLGQLNKVADKLEKLSLNRKQLFDLGLSEEQIVRLENILAKLKKEGSDNIQTAQMGEIQEVFNEVGTLMSQAGDDITRAVGEMVSSLSGMITTLNDANASSFQKISGIVSLAITAGNQLAKIRQDNMNKEVNAQKDYNEDLAEQLTLEAEINRLRRERAEIELNSSAFLDPHFKDQYKNTLNTVKESEALMNKSVADLMDSAVFSSKGKAHRRLFGSKSGTYEFSIQQLLSSYESEILGEGGLLGLNPMANALQMGKNGNITGALASVFLDPAGIFGGYADSKAQKDALKNLESSFEDTLTEMGKSTSDLLNMSTSEWVDFYTLMEEQGKITDKGTLEMIENAKAAAEEYAQAMEDLKGIISDVAGDLGSSLTNDLVTAFENGEDAAIAFQGTVNDVLKSIFMQNLQAELFQSHFDKLQEEMKASMDGGDGSWEDDIKDFFTDIGPAIGQAEEAMEAWDKQMEAAGYTGFDDSASREAASKGFASMSQDSADELNGRFTAIQSHTFSINESIKMLQQNSQQALKHLAGIESNTSSLSRLEVIENTMKGVKSGIDDINTKGVKLK